ncbi:NAD(P)H-binding protein [Loigolactobacillus iwatensis]|uniref:NAD(P)H-binding protein n=1 Tax=Loigolactobacillus iwatensis TaxID=1267156 RepID=UPI000F7F8B4D|nr:NAD(P)H-binding protein [Loigolactobacillus iwatensis]
MAVLVMGGTGKTGFQIVEQLVNKKRKVIIGNHSGKSKLAVSQLNVNLRKFDLIKEDVSQIASKLGDVDVIIFAAGASQSHPEQAEWLDLDGAVKLMDAAKEVGIKRYLMVSAAGAADRATWNIYDIPEYYIAKYYAEKELKNSGLTYTVVRPPILSDGPKTGKASLSKTGNNEIISRADVANMVVLSIDDVRALNRSFDLYSGIEPMDDLLNRL